VAGDWKRLHNEELHSLYYSTNIIRAIKQGMRWTRHVASIGEMTNAYIILLGNPDGKNYSQCVDGRIILDWNFREIRCEVADWIYLA
jgi:hypothetical protein